MSKVRFEDFVFSTIQNLGDWKKRRPTSTDNVMLGGRHSAFALGGSRTLSNPNEHLTSSVQDHHVVVVKLVLGNELARCFQRKPHFARRVREPVQLEQSIVLWKQENVNNINTQPKKGLSRTCFSQAWSPAMPSPLLMGCLMPLWPSSVQKMRTSSSL